jgi:hypothetical protein
MKLNVGGIDRTGRIVIGVVLVAFAAFAPVDVVWRVVAGVVAAIALVTAAIQFCPANALIGINTYKGDDKARE